jgi:hypothetical protein
MDMPGDTITSEGLGGPSYFGANLIESVKNGSVPESRVTDMATRIAAAWYKVMPKCANELAFTPGTDFLYSP